LPARSKAPRVINVNPIGLMKKLSAQACFNVSLTKSLLSTQSLARFEVRRKEERRKRLLGARRNLSKVWGVRE
jgi:hypothetical protein